MLPTTLEGVRVGSGDRRIEGKVSTFPMLGKALPEVAAAWQLRF